MRVYNYRMNGRTFAVSSAVLVVAYTAMLAFTDRPPGIDVLASFIVVPRLHDVGRSGWWYLSVLPVELALVGLGMWLGGSDGIALGAVLFVLLFFLLMIVLTLIPGELGANRWGDPPPRGIHGPTRSRNQLRAMFDSNGGDS